MDITFVQPFVAGQQRGLHVDKTRCGSLTARARARQGIRMTWLETHARLKVEAPREFVFSRYSNLEAMPQWSPWLEKVVVDEQDPTLSTWKLAARGISVSWRARNVRVEEPEIIQWESVTGLSNRGKVTFADADDGASTNMTLTVSFNVPGFIAALMKSDFVGNYVERTLLADLERFRVIALRELRKERVRMHQQQTQSQAQV
ncbi:hypothetical protein FVE85_5621 [Porphyridium purpureum]|uniref:Coenzyme Q-binding protein COQ10 START domain-containing protein n=1 Tax=Porphyridium purpureum TaxID=35688 RepID=A0A5J4Z354_PORPP|nr:hypothetical protein FVE85_5621 [Porphyridium purpureum]|eukprot:POR8255..scf295_1